MMMPPVPVVSSIVGCKSRHAELLAADTYLDIDCMTAVVADRMLAQLGQRHSHSVPCMMTKAFVVVGKILESYRKDVQCHAYIAAYLLVGRRGTGMKGRRLRPMAALAQLAARRYAVVHIVVPEW